MDTNTTTVQVRNGVNVTQMLETIETVKAAPVVAKFRFRAHNRWLDGGHNQSTIDPYYGACEEMTRTKPFVLDADEPPILLGEDRGANPVELLLHALAACVTTAIVYHGAARGIEIQELESRLEGDIDLQGFLGLRDDVRRGYEQIRITFRIKANASDEQVAELMQLAPTLSPVLDSVSKGVPVKVAFETK